MSHTTSLLAAVALTFLLAPAALADESDSGDSSTTDSEESVEVRYKTKTEIDFGDRNVGGTIRGPSGVFSNVVVGQTFNPLITLKTDFDQEIVESVQAIR